MDFVPGAIIDDALFEPCGYSANGLLSVSTSVVSFAKITKRKLLLVLKSKR